MRARARRRIDRIIPSARTGKIKETRTVKKKKITFLPTIKLDPWDPHRSFSSNYIYFFQTRHNILTYKNSIETHSD